VEVRGLHEARLPGNAEHISSLLRSIVQKLDAAFEISRQGFLQIKVRDPIVTLHVQSSYVIHPDPG
jgi:hypothetical protein